MTDNELVTGEREYLNSDEQFHLAERLSKAIGEYLDGTGDYPVDVKYMPLAEYIVSEVIDAWARDLAADAIEEHGWANADD